MPKADRPFPLADWKQCGGAALRSGLVRDGTVLPLTPLTPLGRGTIPAPWPTPNAGGGTGYMSGAKRDTWRPTLAGAVAIAPAGPPPTITADEFRGKGRMAAARVPRPCGGGRPGLLNPAWVSLLMGFPADWTELP